MSETTDREIARSSDDRLSVDELVRSQLQGKSNALDRYDQILWKIRGGYLVVLYSLLTVLSGTEFDLSSMLGDVAKVEVLFFTAISFSSSAFLIDLGFLLSKLRVVEARNELSDLALSIACKRAAENVDPDRLRLLLHLSGDDPRLPGPKLLLGGTWPIVLLYMTTPLTLAIVMADGGP